MKKLWCFCLIWCVCLEAEIFFPLDDFAPGWKVAGKPQQFAKSQLYDHIDGGAELFLEFGFEKVLVQRYKRAADELVLEAYEMESPAAALGVYLTLCGKETPIPGIDSRNSGDKQQFTLVKHKYFVHVNNFQGPDSLYPTMVTLTQQFLKNIPEAAASTLLQELPAQGMRPGSLRLVRGPVALQPIYTLGDGDILKLQGKIFGVVADYDRPPHGIVTSMVIPYPDEDTASAAYRHLKENLDPTAQMLKSWEHGFTFADYQKKCGLVQLRGPRLFITVNLTSVATEETGGDSKWK